MAVLRFHDEVKRIEACSYLELFGLDPGAISQGGLYPHGYREFQFDEDGRKVRFHPSGEPVTTFKQWPAGFSWDEFSRLFYG